MKEISVSLSTQFNKCAHRHRQNEHLAHSNKQTRGGSPCWAFPRLSCRDIPGNVSMSWLLIQEKRQPEVHCLLCVIDTGAYTQSLDPDCGHLLFFLSGVSLFRFSHCVFSFFVFHLTKVRHISNSHFVKRWDPGSIWLFLNKASIETSNHSISGLKGNAISSN